MRSLAATLAATRIGGLRWNAVVAWSHAFTPTVGGLLLVWPTCRASWAGSGVGSLSLLRRAIKKSRDN